MQSALSAWNMGSAPSTIAISAVASSQQFVICAPFNYNFSPKLFFFASPVGSHLLGQAVGSE